MQKYELALLLDAIRFIQRLIEKADARDLTHAQKHMFHQVALIELNEVRQAIEHAVVDDSMDVSF